MRIAAIIDRFSPNLRFDHPGYFTVTASLVVTHLALAVDALLPGRHISGIWTVANALLPFWAWAIVHLSVAAFIVVGCYTDWRLARYAFLVSLLVFNMLGVALLFGAAFHGLSFYPAIASVALSLSSLAAYREPTHNPLLARARRNDR